MKSVNSRNKPAAARRSAVLRPWLVAPLCLLALAVGMLVGGTSRAAAVASQVDGQKTKAAAPASADKGRARARGSRTDNAKPAATKGRDGVYPLADQIGCVTNPSPITINGGTVNGSLANGDCANPVDGSLYDAYTFTATAGQLVIIEMTSTAFDTYLYLLRPGETTLSYRTIQNDDTTADLNSRIVVVLPGTGNTTYTILANSALSGATGAYQLRAFSTGNCTATNIGGGTVNGSLGAGDCQLHDNSFVDVYAFTATAGQQISIEQNSSAFDSFLFLLSNDGFTELARNDDGLTGGGTTNSARGSRIPAPAEGQGAGLATLPAAGTYYILANSFSAGETGAYALTLTLGANCPTQPIAAGTTTTGQSLTTGDCRLPFDGSFMDVYTFDGTAGQQIAITMTGTAFDEYLLLYDPAGFLIDEDNNGAGGTDARLPATSGFLTLPVTGTYRIYANGAAPGLTGAYTLSVASSANCTVTLTQTSRQNVAAAGGQFTDNFTVAAGCPAPTATSNAAFITNVTAQVNAQGQGTFTYTVAANNTGAARSGTITVGGQTFTVSQQANCTVGISPTIVPFAQGGGAGRFTVVPDGNNAQCAWTATTTANFITINTGATGTGTNRVTYTVAANNTGATRSGTIIVNGQTHTVTQLAAGVAPTVAFTSATYAVSETNNSQSNPRHSIIITVTRLGDIAGASTVEYRTVAETDAQANVPCRPAQGQPTGTASPRCDFATTIDRLTFLPNETEKTFAIPIINDVHVEGAETFQIELADPAGATLGGQATATVTINDDDTTPSTTNPVRPPLPYGPDTPRFFVRMQYLDFLSREPEQDEPWTGVLLRAGCNPETPASVQTDCDRIGVSKAFFESDENRRKGRFVFLYYKASFGAAANPNFFPEYRDFVADVRRVTGQTAAETTDKLNNFAEDWVNRPAFTARYNGTTNAQFVDTLLANVNTTLTQGGSGFTRDSLVADLNASTRTRAEVLRLIVESPEVSAQQFNHAYVATQYYGYLRRTPDLSGYLAWLNAINANSQNLRVMVDGFLNSTEYVFRFGPN